MKNKIKIFVIIILIIVVTYILFRFLGLLYPVSLFNMVRGDIIGENTGIGSPYLINILAVVIVVGLYFGISKLLSFSKKERYIGFGSIAVLYVLFNVFLYAQNTRGASSIYPTNKTRFFAFDGSPLVWYHKYPDGNIQFFDYSGAHPLTGDKLMPVNKEVVVNYLMKIHNEKIEKREKMTADIDDKIERESTQKEQALARQLLEIQESEENAKRKLLEIEEENKKIREGSIISAPNWKESIRLVEGGTATEEQTNIKVSCKSIDRHSNKINNFTVSLPNGKQVNKEYFNSGEQIIVELQNYKFRIMIRNIYEREIFDSEAYIEISRIYE
jgi:flagellar biogenesis protein FliO